MKWTLKKKVLPKVYVNVMKEIYEGASKIVRSLCKRNFGQSRSEEDTVDRILWKLRASVVDPK